MSASIKGRDWGRFLRPYRLGGPVRSSAELALTAIPFAILWAGAWFALKHGVWWGLVLTGPAAGLLVRLFIIQHDCGHGSFFSSKNLNDWVGRAISLVTLTPYDYWRRAHAIHHATAGNLDRRGVGDVETLTVMEYLHLPPARRLTYRLFRHPVVMFGLGPAFVFLIRHRLPVGLMTAGWKPWLSTVGTTLATSICALALIRVAGAGLFFLVQAPITLLAGLGGVWLFYLQHQFEGVVWLRGPDWSHRNAALLGSSHYDLPRPLRWFTGDIGLHHIHHLDSRIPFYRLRRVIRDCPELRAGRLTFAEGFRGVGLALWDEAEGRLVSFAHLRRSQGAAICPDAGANGRPDLHLCG